MVSSKRKPGRSPLQRLSDQRRSLALGGLAIGALFSAVILRRKRHGGAAEFEAPIAVDVPPPAGDPVTSDPLPESVDTTEADSAAAETAINASTPTAEPAAVEPATGELSVEEASILSILAQNGRADEDRTAVAVATSLERDTTSVTAALRKLAGEGVVSGELYTAGGDKIWAVTERGVRRLGAQS